MRNYIILSFFLSPSFLFGKFFLGAHKHGPRARPTQVEGIGLCRWEPLDEPNSDDETSLVPEKLDSIMESKPGTTRVFLAQSELDLGGSCTGTVVFRPTVRSLITSGDERNRSGACHRSLGRSNRVTFYPKKESLSKKKFAYLLLTIYHRKSSSTPSS